MSQLEEEKESLSSSLQEQGWSSAPEEPEMIETKPDLAAFTADEVCIPFVYICNYTKISFI